MNLVKIEDNKNKVVKKHQELAHNARYRLSELGIKVVSVLTSMIKASDEEFKEYTLEIKEFKELIGSSSKKTYEYVDAMTDELMKKPFKIGDEKFNWVYYAKYHRGDAVVTLKIAPELKPYLLALSGEFLQYDIINILPLRSCYVIRLYELCKDHRNKATRYNGNTSSAVFDVKIDRLRELFEIPPSYAYKDIRVNIIDKAVKQFKEKTDIQIEYKEQKIGRKVDRLIITVRENNKGSNDFKKSKQAFIAYMREHYVNADIYTSRDKVTNKDLVLSIDPDGKLYNKKGGEFDPDRSYGMWDTLFEMAREDRLPCLQNSMRL